MSEKLKSEAHPTERRQFLKTILIGSGAAAVAVASGGADAAPTKPDAAPAPKAKASGYHVTPHIRDYYKTAQF